MEIKGISVIVTGGASGLGEATARLFAATGAQVTILDKNLEKALNIAEDIQGFALSCDVTNEAEVLDALEQIKNKFGRVRILVNCAGIASAGKVVGKKGALPLMDFEKTIRVNLIGTFNMMRLVAAEMMPLAPLSDGERGVIISTASIAAFDGQIGQTAYAASKGGIVSMTLPAARDLASYGIRVNAIAPGLFMTPLLSSLPEEAIQQLTLNIPFPARLGLAEEYASLAKHIVENKYINGETIRLDGALRMPPK
ncbi:MAG: SDR family NAD(P)-dependent oxidoreductase [Saprospiraceae bacterium]